MLAKVSEVPVCIGRDELGEREGGGGWECLKTVRLLTVERPLKSRLSLSVKNRMIQSEYVKIECEWGLHSGIVCVWQGLRGTATMKVMLNKTFSWVTGHQCKHGRSPAERHRRPSRGIYGYVYTKPKLSQYNCLKIYLHTTENN